MSVIDLDALRTEMHEQAVILAAKRDGKDTATALAESRWFREWASQGGHDLRASIRKSRAFIERT
jgi:hypothetical protein